jgi:SAM-dependent MidA family methyltransferase
MVSGSLLESLLAEIDAGGPMSVARYMAACLYDPAHGYYAKRPALGGQGDFITAPEVSQMFGELIGLWGAESWQAMGTSAPLNWIELGPGNGALTSDAWRAWRAVPRLREAVQISFVETSQVLRARQRDAVPNAAHFDRIEDAPEGPAIMIGNEFLDCLPIRQYVRVGQGWRERLVGRDPVDPAKLAFGLGGPVIPLSREAPLGAIFELAPGLAAFVDAVAQRLARFSGRCLLIDYGGEPGFGDTLQALRGHLKVDPLACPGEADLTAHVDFAALQALAEHAGLFVHGPVAQGAFLEALGLGARAEALARAQPSHAEKLVRQRARLASPDGMGTHFKVLCLSSTGLPPPPGF